MQETTAKLISFLFSLQSPGYLDIIDNLINIYGITITARYFHFTLHVPRYMKNYVQIFLRKTLRDKFV